MTTDFRLKKCPICKWFWCHINEPMCGNCKSKGYLTEAKSIVSPIGIQSKQRITIKGKVKPKNG